MKDRSRHRASPRPSDTNRPIPDVDQVDQPLEEDHVSGTDIAGDETNVRTREGVDQPGIAEKIPGDTEDPDTRKGR